MNNPNIIQRGLALMIIIVLMLPAGIYAQDPAVPDTAPKFSREELTQMLAPIALYPDSLLAQILMAATYPLEVVEAERWMHQNPGLKGDALDKALLDKPWDTSVQSLCHYPDVLYAMSSKLDQTRKLGDAYLAQPDDVMATVQDLRRRAEEQGNLKSTSQQNVAVERDVITIAPTDPEVVYVPVYDPYYIYGPWWYPAYYPWYWYYPPGLAITGSFIWWGSPFFIGFGLFSWCWFDWWGHSIFIDSDRANHFHRHHDGGSGKHQWQHDPVHRRGVAYRDRRTSENFGQQPVQRRKIDSQMRGYPSREERQRATAPGTATDRERSRERIEQRGTTAPGTTTGRERSRERIEQRGTTAPPSARTERQRMQAAPRTETPFRGVGEGSFERRAGERGSQSLRSGRPDVNIQQRQGDGRSMQPQREGGSYRSAPQQQAPSGGSRGGGGQGGGSRGGGGQPGGFRR